MRNDISRFSQNPRADVRRSKLSRDSDYKTTLNSGVLVPFYVDDVMPGDTFDMSTSAMLRMSTPLYPVMDNAYLDYYFFFVPGRLLWDHFEEFHGASSSAWDDPIDWEIPQLHVPSGGFPLGSVADYFGIPTNAGYVYNSLSSSNNETVNALPFRGYRKIWNDYFRDVNLMDEVMLNLGDDGDTSSADPYKLWDLLPVSKFHDYFTSALPQPQRGDPVTLELFGSQTVPVFASGNMNEHFANGSSADRLRFKVTGGTGTDTLIGGSVHVAALRSDGSGLFGLSESASGGTSYPVANGSVSNSGTVEPGPQYNWATPVNLVAEIPAADAVTINQLREAFQIQAVLEADARGGNRYTSLIRQHFGVISPDGRLQRAEYLGGKRVPIKTQDVTQTAPGLVEDQRGLGSVGAYSKTIDAAGSFTKSFTEHGYLIGVMCVRTDKAYQQGLNRLWSKKKRYDYYLPELAHIGEQPIYNREIFWQSFNGENVNPESANSAYGFAQNNEVFGYQEAWADYRYKPSLVTGYFRSNAPGGSLDAYHYAEYYDKLPHLDENWIVEDPGVIDRTLKMSSDVTHQFLVDMYFNCTATRPMPVYSIPGLGGHF